MLHVLFTFVNLCLMRCCLSLFIIHSFIVHISSTGVECKDPSIPVWVRKTHHSNVGRFGSPYEMFFIRALDPRIWLNTGLSEHRRVCHWLYRYKQKWSSCISFIHMISTMFPMYSNIMNDLFLFQRFSYHSVVFAESWTHSC